MKRPEIRFIPKRIQVVSAKSYFIVHPPRNDHMIWGFAATHQGVSWPSRFRFENWSSPALRRGFRTKSPPRRLGFPRTPSAACSGVAGKPGNSLRATGDLPPLRGPSWMLVFHNNWIHLQQWFRSRRFQIQRTVRPQGFVVDSPLFYENLRFHKCIEYLSIQKFFSKSLR